MIAGRRQALHTLARTATGMGLCGFCRAHAAPPTIFGCILPPARAGYFLDRSTRAERYITGQEPIVKKSNDRDFDFALAQTLAKIASVFEVLPGFAYYEDVEAQNAYATPAVKLNNADGTVLFGQNLLQSVLAQRDNPDVAAAAICAHEFGHILQFKHGLEKVVGAGQKTVKRAELQADFFAGYFAGVRRREKPTFPAAVFAATQFNLGDEQVGSPGHHGTPAERGDAVSEGFNASYRLGLNIAAAIERSTNYVMAR